MLGRRGDGLHDLDSIVAFADLGDVLHFEPAARFAIESSGPFAPALPFTGDNIIAKAWRALRAPPVRIAIEKNLPVAAGLGGGSANAAATLRGLIRLFNLQPPDLAGLAMSLGADVPVCLAQVTARMGGAGEIVTPLNGVGPFHAVLVNPGILVSTAAVFQRLKLLSPHPLDLADSRTWRNDLTAGALSLAPEIAGVLAAFTPWTTARMSGSGATCCGLFKDEYAAAEAALSITIEHPQWWVKAVKLG